MSIRLFGSFCVEQNGSPFPHLRTRKEQWLFAILVLHPRPLEREWLAGLLWPDSPQEAAFANLRRSLTQLRRALGIESGRLISDSPRTIRFDIEGAQVDVFEFDAAIARGDVESLRTAASLYCGPLMPTCDLDWISQEREARHERHLEVLEKLADFASVDGDSHSAIGFLRSAIAADPVREGPHRKLMGIFAARAEYSAAIQVYRELQLLLHDNVWTEPAPETTALFEQIRETARQKVERPILDNPPSRLRKLPIPLSDLIAREEEVEELRICLESARLLTLVGPGGIGKTRLAIAVAARVSASFSDGLWFVDLALVSSESGLSQAVASAISAPERAGMCSEKNTTDYLENRRALIVLDNCEHIVQACAQFSVRLLEACPNLRILATSRQALDVFGETAWPVPPLTTPKEAGQLPAYKTQGQDHVPDAERLMQYGAVRLFVARARQARPLMRITARNAAAIAEICERLDGIPLAIELAASQMRALSPFQIAQRLDRGFSLRMRGGHSLPRHQTLAATLDWSHRLMSRQECMLFRRLAVFSGSWNLDAAESICRGDGIDKQHVASLLISLTESSLVNCTDCGGENRCDFLETIRQYAEQKLIEAKEERRYQTRHFAYFFALARQATINMPGPNEASWTKRLDDDHGNLTTALQRGSVLHASGIPSLKLAATLARFWTIRGYLAQGRECLEELLAKTSASSRVRARGFLALGRVKRFQHAYKDSIAACEESLRLARECNDKRAIAEALMALGSSSGMNGDNLLARRYLEECVTLSRDDGDPHIEAESLGVLGNIAKDMGNYSDALSYYQQSLSCYRELKEPAGIAVRLQCCGFIHDYQGDLKQAAKLYEESLNMLESLGNKSLMGYSLHHLAAVKRKLGELAAARELLFRQEALGSSDEQGMAPGAPWQRLALGLCSLQEADIQSARQRFGEAIELVRNSQDPLVTAFSVLCAGILASALCEFDSAAALFGAADGIRDLERVVVLARADDAYGPALTRTLEGLGADAFRVAWKAGQKLERRQALEVAADFCGAALS